MAQRQDGMTPQHARAGPAHDIADTLPHGGLVTMDGATRTSGLISLVGTFIQASLNIR